MPDLPHSILVATALSSDAPSPVGRASGNGWVLKALSIPHHCKRSKIRMKRESLEPLDQAVALMPAALMPPALRSMPLAEIPADAVAVPVAAVALPEGLVPAASAPLEQPDAAEENFGHQLAVVRLGIAGSLFTALDCKHPPTASHSLRTALACSHWALTLQLDEEEISQLEVAALLHDIGKVAFPDAILLKPGHLAPGELALMDGYRRAGLRILGSCCARPRFWTSCGICPPGTTAAGRTIRFRAARFPLVRGCWRSSMPSIR